MFKNYCLKCVLTIFWALNFVACMQSMKQSMAHIKSQVTLSEATLHHLSGSCVVASMALYNVLICMYWLSHFWFPYLYTLFSMQVSFWGVAHDSIFAVTIAVTWYFHWRLNCCEDRTEFACYFAVEDLLEELFRLLIFSQWGSYLDIQKYMCAFHKKLVWSTAVVTRLLLRCAAGHKVVLSIPGRNFKGAGIQKHSST